jgi:superfamily II DNA or RNA helicase
MGDYAREELAEAADRPSITGCAIDHYQRIAAGLPAVVFCVSIKHSRHVVEQFRAAGIVAQHVDGETPTMERDEAIRRFANGDIQVLSNVDLFGEGFDVPEISCVILLRPTQSLTLFLQSIGRAMRPAPGKDEAIILDHAGNVMRHGLPDDIREWDLRGRKQGAASQECPVKICPGCFLTVPAAVTKCPDCEHVFVNGDGGREVAQREGQLEEIDIEAFRRDQERRAERRRQGMARSEEELVAIGESRGYKRPRLWARHVLIARARRGR